MKNYNHFSAQAPLALVGEEVKRKRIWDVIVKHVHIRQKRAGHLPTDKLKDAWINILSGGKEVVEVNTRVKPDRGIQKAFGRDGCAEQSTISRCLTACSSENVEPMRQAVQEIVREHSRSYKHNFEQRHQWLDVDMTGMLAGRQGEGVTKGYFSHASNVRGRQVGRVFASRYNEIVVDRLYPGKVQLEHSLQPLVSAAETTLDLDEARRKRTIIRFAGYGWLRMVRDLFHIPGKLTLNPQNRLIAITLSREHGLSKDLFDTLRTSKSVNDLLLILRKI